MRLRIASWNINSVRPRAEQVARFIAEAAPDVLCLQEIKCREGEFPKAVFAEAGLPHLKIAGQKGWHGVAIASRLPIEDAPRSASAARGTPARSRGASRASRCRTSTCRRAATSRTARSIPSSTTSSTSSSA